MVPLRGSDGLERNAGAIRRPSAIATRDDGWDRAYRRPLRRAPAGRDGVPAVGAVVRRRTGMADPGDPVRRRHPLLAVAAVAAAPSRRSGRAPARVTGRRGRRADRRLSARRAAERPDPRGDVGGGGRRASRGPDPARPAGVVRADAVAADRRRSVGDRQARRRPRTADTAARRRRGTARRTRRAGERQGHGDRRARSGLRVAP